MSRTDEIAAAIRSKMAARVLTSGEKLPSIRSFAAAMGVSPSTVVEAYDRLAAEGVIRSRPGSGFYVSGALPPLALAETEPRLDREVDPFWVSRQSLDAAPETRKPGCGWLPADWMPNDVLRRAIRQLSKADDSLLADYGCARGSPSLRRVILRELSEAGIAASPDNVLLTTSGTQAIDLICRFFLQPGDTVLVDDPCYFNFQALLRAHRVKIVGVPHTPNGPDPDLFASALEAHRPRLYVTNSALHNPTGATLSPQTAFRLLNLAAAHDLIMVEDEIFADFEPEPSSRMAALDGLSRVIRIGSFSKTLSAAIRCGYIAARADWIESLIDLQIATNFGGPSPVAAAIIAAALGDSGYRKHVHALRLRLAKARRQATAGLASLGIIPWIMPRGGFYLWCKVPSGRDSAHMARRALDQGLVLAPGNVFSPSKTLAHFMRFNVAHMNEPAVFETLGRLLAD